MPQHDKSSGSDATSNPAQRWFETYREVERFMERTGKLPLESAGAATAPEARLGGWMRYQRRRARREMPKRSRAENDIVSGSAFVGKAFSPHGTPSVRARRMRNTWLVQHLTNRVDVYTLMQAAGLQSLESISRLAHLVPTLSDEARIAQLRGAK